MNKKVLLVPAALPLVLAPPALAETDRSEGEGESVCEVPTVDTQYDVEQFVIHVSLPASGCASREHRIFELSAKVIRMDNNWGRDVHEWSTTCGPFRSADDFEPGDAAPQYSCDLSVAVDHPKVENAQYDVEITYPGAAAERTMTGVLFCTSDGDNATCDR